jgi:hypothetical protein
MPRYLKVNYFPCDARDGLLQGLIARKEANRSSVLKAYLLAD